MAQFSIGTSFMKLRHFIVKKTLMAAVAQVVLLFGITANHASAQRQKAVTDEEYKIYSAFIDRVYLAPESGWFTLQGRKTQKIPGPAQRQAVIADVTIGNALDIYLSKEVLAKFPKTVLEDYSKKNKGSSRLINKFKTNLPSYLWEQSLEEQRKISEESQRRIVSWETVFSEKFFGKFPKAKGYLFLSRVGFDPSRKRALLFVSQNDFNAKYSSFGGGSVSVIYFIKSRGKWKLKKVFPKENIYKIDLKKCRQDPFHIGLALGSMSVQINGLMSDKCSITDFYEIEGGYTETECRIPASLNEISVTPNWQDFFGFLYSKDISAYCLEPKSGNDLMNGLRPD